MSDKLTITYGAFGYFQTRVTPDEQQALLTIIREMIARTTALEQDLYDAGVAARLSKDLMTDTFMGFVSRALDDANRLEYGLTHPTVPDKG